MFTYLDFTIPFKYSAFEDNGVEASDSRSGLESMFEAVYSFLKDEDIHAIFMYLNSIKPIENVVPSAMLANSISH